MRQLSQIIIAPLLLLGLLASCSGGGEEVRVFAASSLTDVMPRLVEGFQSERPGVSFEVAYGGSQALATQIEEGAPADVFVSANPQQAERLAAEGRSDAARPIARNELVIAVEQDSAITTLDDLAAAGVTIALGAPNVPVGALTAQLLETLPEAQRRGIRANVITEDPNVRAVLSRVDTGDAEAAFIYRTDLAAVPGLRAIDLDGAPSTTYVALTIADDRAPSDAARAFLAYLASPAAAAILREAGFAPIEAAS